MDHIHFWEDRGSLPCSQKPSTCPYPQTDYSIPFNPIHFNIILPCTLRYSEWFLYCRFPHQNPARVSFLPHTCFVPHPQWGWIRSWNGGSFSYMQWLLQLEAVTVLPWAGASVTHSGSWSVLTGRGLWWFPAFSFVPVHNYRHTPGNVTRLTFSRWTSRGF